MTTQHIVRRVAVVVAGAASFLAVSGAAASAAPSALPVPLGGGGSSHCLTQPKSWTLPLDLQGLACVGLLQSGKGGPTSLVSDATGMAGGLPVGDPTKLTQTLPATDATKLTENLPAADAAKVTEKLPAADATSVLPVN